MCVKDCLFCGCREEGKLRRCPQCGLGPKNPPWDLTPWEGAPFLSAQLSWVMTLWQLCWTPRKFFKSFKPVGAVARAWTVVLPLFLLTGLGYVLLISKWYSLDQSTKPFMFLNDTFANDQWHAGYGLMVYYIRMVSLWLVLTLGVTCLLHFSLNVNKFGKFSWWIVFKIICYGLLPFALAFVVHVIFLYGALQWISEELGELEVIVSVAVLFVLPIFWSYHLIKIAIEECFRMPRDEARMVVFVLVLLVFVFFKFKDYLL